MRMNSMTTTVSSATKKVSSTVATVASELFTRPASTPKNSPNSGTVNTAPSTIFALNVNYLDVRLYQISPN